MVNGLNNTVEALNDYLVELLQERDVLLSQQVDMGRTSKTTSVLPGSVVKVKFYI